MSEAKEKLLSVLRNDVWTPEKIADAILAAGFVLPEKPKVDLVDEEAKRLWEELWRPSWEGDTTTTWDGANPSCRSGMRAIARDSLARQCEAYLAGVRDRCNLEPMLPCSGTKCDGGTLKDKEKCGDLQRAAERKYGQTTD